MCSYAKIVSECISLRDTMRNNTNYLITYYATRVANLQKK